MTRSLFTNSEPHTYNILRKVTLLQSLIVSDQTLSHRSLLLRPTFSDLRTFGPFFNEYILQSDTVRRRLSGLVYCLVTRKLKQYISIILNHSSKSPHTPFYGRTSSKVCPPVPDLLTKLLKKRLLPDSLFYHRPLSLTSSLLIKSNSNDSS